MVEKYSRRAFLKKSAACTAAVGGSALLGNMDRLFAQDSAGAIPDLVAVKNGEPAALFDAAVKAAGGIGQYVKKGQTIVVKPNIGWNRSPETGANTNPALVKRIVEQCMGAGAKKVYVFDHSVDSGSRCYKKSGIGEAVKSAGGLMVPGNHKKYYQEVDIPGAETLPVAKVHELIMESDVYINVPVLKHHSSSRLTLAMKNQMGVVWNRGEWHWKGLHRCISDFCRFRPPDLNIVDGYRVTLRNGPQRASKDDVVVKKTLLLSKDIVAVDAAAARIFGARPDEISYIHYAHEAGIGSMDLGSLNIKRINLAG